MTQYPFQENSFPLSEETVSSWKNTPILPEDGFGEIWKDYKSYQDLGVSENNEPLDSTDNYEIIGYDYYAQRAKKATFSNEDIGINIIEKQNQMFHKLLQSGILSQKCLLRKQLLIDISGMNEQLKSIGYQIVIMSGYRPPLVQLIAREAYELMHGRENSFRMFGSPKTGPHCSGGSCDIEIADLQGNILPSKFSENNSMGLCFGESLLQQKEGFLTLYEQEAIQNRRFIYHLMRHLGFYPHLAEYWHYGRGDRLSIYLKNQLTGIGNSAIYGTVLPSKEEIQKLAYLVR